MSDISKTAIDPTPLRVLRSAGVGTESLREVCDLFHTVVDIGLKELSLSGVEKDKLSDIVHRLRGSCLSIGAVQLQERLREYLDEANDGRLPSLSKVHAEFENTKAALAKLMNELENPQASA
jgi:hypothetical protein